MEWPPSEQDYKKRLEDWQRLEDSIEEVRTQSREVCKEMEYLVLAIRDLIGRIPPKG